MLFSPRAYGSAAGLGRDSPLGEQVLEVDHLHHDVDVLLGGGAEVVLHVALALQLEHHVLHRQAPAADAAELVPKPVGHALQRVLDEGLPLRGPQTETHAGHRLERKLCRQRRDTPVFRLDGNLGQLAAFF